MSSAVDPLDGDITYRTYKFTKDPTLWDYITYLPSNLKFYFQNLSAAFGMKFVLIVAIVYGLQQGKML